MSATQAAVLTILVSITSAILVSEVFDIYKELKHMNKTLDAIAQHQAQNR